jgi:ABC-type glycerol-3-phosphate transport system substrate-binding protein
VQIRTKSLAVAGVAALSLALAACSSSGSTSGGGTSSKPGGTSSGGGSSTAAGGSTAKLSGQSFTILGQWTGAEQSAFQAVLSKFNQETGAHGTYQAAAGGNEATVLGTQVNGGNPPDIAILSLPGAIAQYATAGKLQPVASAGQQAVQQNFASEWGTLATVNGKLYGTPVDASDKSTVWYNATLFKNAGISSMPTTWPAFIKDAKTLSASGISVPISVGGGDGWTLTDWFENVYIRTAGLQMYDKLTHHQIKWTDPSVATALNTLKQIWGDSSLIGSPSAALKVPFTNSVDAVFKAKPSSAIVYEASFVATTIQGDKDPAKVGTVAKFFPFPSINGSKPVLESAGDFAVAFSKSKAAQAFLAYLASPEAGQILVSAPDSGFLSANKNVPNSAYPNSITAQLAKQVVGVGNNFRFDMSDQAPATFGGTPNKGEWADLQTFLRTGNVKAAQQQLEKDASAAKGWTK